MEFNSVDEVLDFAIESEQNASDFYRDLADKVDNPNISRMFMGFAGEEMGHKKKLEAIKSGKILQTDKRNVLNMKIAESLQPVEPHEDMNLQEALVVAMQREKEAFLLYNALAGATTDENVRATFEMLAQEEAKHKLRFEVEYDEMVMSEN